MNARGVGPILFVDEDAFILDRCRPGDRDPLNTANIGTVEIPDRMLRDPLQVSYSRRAVEFINKATAAYEILWLTGLGAWAPKILAPAIGLDHFDSACQYDFETHVDLDPIADGSRWWKDLVVREAIADTKRRFVWVDDQITSRVVRRMNADTIESQALLVPLTKAAALEDRHFDLIAGFVGVRRAAR
jgi:hypothetical protein